MEVVFNNEMMPNGLTRRVYRGSLTAKEFNDRRNLPDLTPLIPGYRRTAQSYQQDATDRDKFTFIILDDEIPQR